MSEGATPTGARPPAFATCGLPAAPTVTAPDGCDVRVLLALGGGSMAHFELAAGQVSAPVTHRTVEEIWYVTGGRGEMWRRQDGREEVVPLAPGTCLTIPLQTHFQFRSLGPQALAAVAITMPPWPGPQEAVAVEGRWKPTVSGAGGSEESGLPGLSGTTGTSELP